MQWRRMSKDVKIFLLAFLAEWGLLVWFRNDFGFIAGPLLLLLSNFIMAYYFLKINKTVSAQNTIGNDFQKLWLIYIAGVIITGVFGVSLILQNPPLIENSDIGFLINEVYVKRFVNGESVYSPYSGFNYGQFTPNYLPFHWLPFCISYLLGFDQRYIVLAFLFLSIAYYYYHLGKMNHSRFDFWVKCILPFALVLSIFLKQGKDFANTVEILLSSYYLFLALSLFSKGNFPKIMGITFTFLSRYILLFWLPVLALNEWMNNKKRMLILLAACILSVFLFFVLPFVLRQPDMVSQIGNLYVKASVGEWDGQAWQKPGDKPFQLFQGTGFASWVYEFTDGTLVNKIERINKLLFLFSGGTMLLLLFLRLKWLQKIPSQIYALFSLKISIVVFLSFVVIPYVYLFWTVLFISLAMVLNTPLYRDEEIN